nr:MAG TPA: hypothetical protein [Bacteriophage sp.]
MNTVLSPSDVATNLSDITYEELTPTQLGLSSANTFG